MQLRHEIEVDVHREVIGCPLVLAVSGGKIKSMNRMTIKHGPWILNQYIMPVDSYRLCVVEDGEGQDFSMQLALSVDLLEKFHDASHGHGHAMRILSFGGIQAP